MSVTAIVVLILAIVMLGLGLGFIRGMFGKVSSQIEQQISVEAEPPIPTALIPITLSREVIITNSGNKEIIKVSTFNPTATSWIGEEPSVDCGDFLVDSSANSKNVEQGEFVTFNLLLTIPATAPDTHLCKLKMGPADEYQKDFTIKINE